MQPFKIAGVALALLMITGTAAAIPGAAPAQADEITDGANETDTDRGDEATASAGPSERGADRCGAAQNVDRGPPAGLPGQVPDFVGGLHDTVGQLLNSECKCPRAGPSAV